MIKKLRRKLVIILMSVVTLILLAVFAAMLLSTSGNSRRMSEMRLSQALNVFFAPQSPESGIPQPYETQKAGMAGAPLPSYPESRTSVIVAELGVGGEVRIITNQMRFMDDEAVFEAVQKAMSRGGETGVLSGEGLRWLKSGDGRIIAFADISMEQELLKNLVVNALPIGSAALAVFFLISLFLSRWAVRPVERAWERQRQFVADASHELKTPLTVIMSNAEMLCVSEAFPDEKNARRIEHIRAESLLMKKLVESLLTLAKSDSIESSLITEQVDFSFIVTNTILTFEPVVFGEGKELSYDVAESICVTGDVSRLAQLMTILLDNAVKYCSPGGKISVRLGAAERKSALLTVSNDGDPIPRDELSQIFERFYRVDKSRNACGSFGLGLPIAQRIVREHKGEIWAESEGAENRFYVRLPQY